MEEQRGVAVVLAAVPHKLRAVLQADGADAVGAERAP